MAKSVKLKRIAFSDEKIFNLIQLYRQNECLWNIKSPSYKNNAQRKAALTKISEKLELSEEIVKKKISSIRATYILEKKKITDSWGTGRGTVYVPTIPWFKAMEFLNDVIISRKTTCNLKSQIITQNEVEEDGGSQQQSLEETIESTQPETDNNTELLHRIILPIPKNAQGRQISTQPTHVLPSHTDHYTRGQSQSKRKKTGKSNDTSIDAVLKKLCNMTEKDVFDNFGNLIASQLRSIPIIDALELQSDISEMINRRLLAIHRAKHISSFEASRSSSQASHFSSAPTSRSVSQASSRRSSSHLIQNLQSPDYETFRQDSQSSDPDNTQTVIKVECFT